MQLCWRGQTGCELHTQIPTKFKFMIIMIIYIYRYICQLPYIHIYIMLLTSSNKTQAVVNKSAACQHPRPTRNPWSEAPGAFLWICKRFLKALVAALFGTRRGGSTISGAVDCGMLMLILRFFGRFWEFCWIKNTEHQLYTVVSHVGDWRIDKLGLRRSTLSQISMSSRSVGWLEWGLVLFISEIPESMPASVCYYNLLLQIVDIFMFWVYAGGFTPRIFCSVSNSAGKDADRATVTFADHSVREALLVGAEPDCYLAEVIISGYLQVFLDVWCKHVAFANLWYVFFCQIL